MKNITLKRGKIKKTPAVFLAIIAAIALSATTLIAASQNASAAAVIPETHGIPTTVVVHHKIHTVPGGTSNSTSTVLGGMIVDGY